MADNTGIEWCDATWNPIRGCSRVSEGCRHCYAERVAARFAGPGQPYEGLARRVGTEARWTNEVRLVESALDQPLRWKKPRRIFVNSMSDLFHEALPDAAIDTILAVMVLAPQHTFLVLTKRPERMRGYLSAPHLGLRIAEAAYDNLGDDRGDGAALAGWGRLGNPLPLRNLWLGVSIEDQATADARIPLLLQTPARVRFVSAEPLLGPVDLRLHLSRTSIHCPEHVTERIPLDEVSYLQAPSRAFVTPLCPVCGGTAKAGLAPALDWVIVGGESGPRARPMHPAWARQLRDQCAEANVPFFFKQWGSCWPEPNAWMAPGWRQQVERYGSPKKLEATIEGVLHHEWPTP